MSSLADLLSLGAPPALQGSIAAAMPRGQQFNIPQAAPQAVPQQFRQPSKLGSILGMLGDALLVAHGQQPMYQQRLQQQQQTQALQGFLTNPDQAIQSLMAVPGQAANAIDLYKAVHPASETPLEIKLLQHLKEHPEDASALHQIDAELHPGMVSPLTMEAGATVQTPGASGPPQQAVDYLKAHPELAPHFDEKYGPGAAAKILGGATASTPSLPFR